MPDSNITALPTLREAAIALAGEGWKVFPVVPGGKTPLTEHGWKDASTDPVQIEAWWSATPDANIGLALHDSGVAVVDLDPPAMEAGADARFLVDPTWTVRTPRGGLHLYYEGEIAGTAGRLGHGIDTRGRGGYVLAPPSRTDAGEYRVERDHPMTPLPGWISAALDKGTRSALPAAPHEPDDPANVARAWEWLCRQLPLVPGHGANDALYRIAARWRDLGVSEGRAADRILFWADLAAAQEARQVVRNAYAYAQNAPGAHATAPASVTFAGATAALAEPAADDGPEPLDVLLAETEQPVREIVPGLIERGITTLLSAPGDSFKSTLALQIGLCVAAGAPVWGRAVEQANVLHLSYEDGRSEIARRARKIVAALHLPAGIPAEIWDMRAKQLGPLLDVTDTGPPMELPFMARLQTHLRARPGHTLLILDSAYNVLRFGRDARINEDAVNAAIQRLDRLCADADCTILALYHPTRAGAARGDAGNSTAWDSAPRARLGMKRDDDRKDVVVLSVEKRNHGAKGEPITLRYSAGLLAPLTAGDKGDIAGAVLAVALMAAEAGDPIQKQRKLDRGDWRMGEIERRAGWKPPDREVKAALAQALADGRLRYQRGGGTHQAAGYYPPIASAADAGAALSGGANGH